MYFKELKQGFYSALQDAIPHPARFGFYNKCLAS